MSSSVARDTPTRAADIGILFLLTAATATWGWAAVRTILNPFNAGLDRQWALFCVVAAALAAILILASRTLARSTFALLAVAGLTLLIGGHHLRPFVSALWIITVIWLVGDFVLERVVLPHDHPHADRPVLTLGIGLSCILVLLLALALTGAFDVTTLHFVFAAIVLIRIRRVVSLVTSIPEASVASVAGDRASVALIGATAVTSGFFNFVWSLVPEVQWDPLYYHLPTARAFITAGRLVELPDTWASYACRMLDLLFAAGLALGDETTCKLLMFFTGIATALAVYTIASRLAGRTCSTWAAVLFYSSPVVSWSSSTALVDLPLTFLILTAIVAFHRWVTSRQSVWGPVTALLCGTAFGVKASALYAMPVLIATAVIASRRSTIGNAGWLRSMAKWFLIFLLTGAPYYIAVYTWTGNPFFPYYNNVFPSELWHKPNGESDLREPVVKSLTEFIALPVRIVVDTDFYNLGEAIKDGFAGISFLLLPLAIARGIRRERTARWLLAMTLLGFVIWALSAPAVRYGIQSIALTIILGVAALDRARGQRFTTAMLSVTLIGHAAVLPSLYWSTPERIPVATAFARESPDHLRARVTSLGAEATFWLNRHTQPDSQIIGYNVEDMRFWLQRPMSSIEQSRDLAWLTRKGLDDATLARELAQRHFQYIYMRRPPLSVLEEIPFATGRFLRRFAKLEYVEGHYVVYRLFGEPRNLETTSNLLANPNFEEAGGSVANWDGADDGSLAPQNGVDGSNAIAVTTEASPHQTIPVAGGHEYVLAQSIRSTLPESKVRMQILWQDSSGQMISASVAVAGASDSWKRYTITAFAPAEARSAAICLPGQSGEAFVDDVEFAEVREIAGEPHRP